MAVKTQSKELFPSPNGCFAVQLSNFREPNNGNVLCNFALLDSRSVVIDPFEELVAFGAFGCWSNDSMFFVLSAGRGDCIFLYDVSKNVFGVIRIVSDAYLVMCFGNTGSLEIGVSPDSLAAANCQHVVGGGLSEYPAERFKSPDTLRLDIYQLDWHPRAQFSQLIKILESLPMLDMRLKPDGFFEFKGKFPETTLDKISGRLLSVWQLERFAKYGDLQATRWLDEVKRLAGDRLRSQHSIMRYLGELSRETPPPTERA